MPYKIDDLLTAGLEKPVKNVQTAQAVQAPQKIEEKPIVKQKKVKTARKIMEKTSKETSPIVKKAADILTVVLMSAVAVAAIALIVRGIQFLFSI